MQTADFVTTDFNGKSNHAKATVAFTMALNAVEAGHSAMLLLMVKAVELGVPGACEGMDIGKPPKPTADRLKAYLEGGDQIGICGASCFITGSRLNRWRPSMRS